jgi:group I intron endonuclease
MSGKIYLICLNGEPKYVGYTMRSLEVRWKQHCKEARNNPESNIVLHRAIRKYGKDAFSVELIVEHPSKEYTLNVLEPLWIDNFGTYIQDGGYNVTLGGDGSYGFKHNEDAKKKMSEYHRNKTLSPEHKKNIGLSVSGSKNGNFGRKHSEATKEKCRQAALAQAECRRKIKETL